MRRNRLYKKLKVNFPLLLLAALLTNSVVCTAAAPDSVLITGFPDKASVSRIYSDGKIEQIEIPASQPKGGSLPYGTDLPAPSPNNKYVAFVRDNNLWVLDVGQRTTRKITETEKEKVKIAGVSITGWAWDSRRLLYYLQPAVESSEPYSSQAVGSMLFADADNFRVVDLDDGKTQTISLPGRFVAWLADGSFLLIMGSSTEEPIVRWHPEKGPSKIFVAEGAGYGQFHTSRDGSFVLAKANFPDKKSEIVKIDAANGKLTRLTSGGSFAQYQWPSSSPSGQKLGYFLRRGDDRGISVGDLIVDGKAVARYTHWPKFTWINEDVIVLRDNCRLSVISLQGRRVVAQQKIPTQNENNRERYCRALETVK